MSSTCIFKKMCVSHSFFDPMAAYAALLALARSLQDILDLKQYVDLLQKEKIIYLSGIVDFIVTFLEDYSDKNSGAVDWLGNEIRKAAYEAQDFMDSYYCLVLTTDYWNFSADKVKLDRDLTMAFERMGFIWEMTMKMKNSDAAKDLQSVSHSSPVGHSSTFQATARKMVVGFDDDLNSIKERLYEDSSKLQIIPIVGMGGIGKTTLARRAYDDSLLSQFFDKCAWITVSQEYQRREILSGLFKSIKNERSDKSEEELAKLVYQNLLGRRYLVVIDDMWSTKAWDDLKMIFPDDGNGSRILLTTRLLDVASYAGSSDNPWVHQMSFINEDQSWELLQQRVFGQQSCPLQLVEVGRKIAKNCGGLPLTIVVVAGLLLSSGNVMREQLWENISENISSREPTIALQCSKILCFSYDQLPLRLKPCFLYIAGFPEDSEIDVSKLIKLWVAEGFLKPNDGFKCLEDVGERYLEDLVNRSLLLVMEKSPDGKLENVGIHDMLREICITKAEEEEFLHHVSSKANLRTKVIVNPYRRLKIHFKRIFQEWNILDSRVRSILLFAEIRLEQKLCLRSRHIGVLEAPGVIWQKFSHVVSIFVNLRYFAFAIGYASCPQGLPISLSKHPNLETIVVHCRINSSWDEIILQVPCEILKMRKLRHLIWDNPFRLRSYEYHPTHIGIVHESCLQTIETAIDLIFDEKMIKTLVNVKKLKVEYHMENRRWDDFNLDNLFHLQNLEDLEISMYLPLHDPSNSMMWNHAFPMGLKRLSLQGVPFPWENMAIIGSLPNLLVLHMINIKATEFSEWTMMDGQFLQLKYLHSSLDHLEEWEMEKEHLPRLESLILTRAQISEIPSAIGEIDTLQYIELRYCEKSLVDSAKQIQKYQHENGNDAFRVRVVDDRAYDVLF